MEPFCVVLKRTLSSSHPLHQILKYHCRDVTVPNTIGAPKLVGEGEFMDQLFAFGNNGTTRLLREAHNLSTWDVTDFRNEIKVCDASVFPLNVSTYKNSKHFGQPKHFFRLKRHINVFLLTTIFSQPFSPTKEPKQKKKLNSYIFMQSFNKLVPNTSFLFPFLSSLLLPPLFFTFGYTHVRWSLKSYQMNTTSSIEYFTRKAFTDNVLHVSNQNASWNGDPYIVLQSPLFLMASLTWWPYLNYCLKGRKELQRHK